MSYIKRVSLFPGGTIVMPPSKSIAHRAVICSALAGESVDGALSGISEDVAATARCAAMLFDEGERVFDCGESGSTLRFILPVASLYAGRKIFTGRGRLMKRPMEPYLDELRRHGLTIEREDDRIVVDGVLQHGIYALPGDISSQFVSGLLMALARRQGDSEIRLTSPLASASYVDVTLDVMRQFGVTAYNDNYDRLLIHGGQRYVRANVRLEADYSQAAFFLVAGALGYPCKCMGLVQYSRQGDGCIVDLIKDSGAQVRRTGDGGLTAYPCNDIKPMLIDATHIPDLVPPLAVLLAFAEGPSRIINAGRLRMKESDRLSAICTELHKLGAKIRAGSDYIDIMGVKRLKGGVMNSRGDHRIAMMGAVAAIRSDRPVFVENAGCVAKSYPNFWDDFEKTNKDVGV
ncbi:MAG: 3-phosphoshikimate 1-carboxyvinyltransferase [Oscillospiraceae bacterium]|jgi:3-phosphoshikimate 1-carboxyvinyltransferase|nr:3-phosphoshikimate 1-carboxyvinyltransferase [Oscillospiraceae bacterium]